MRHCTDTQRLVLNENREVALALLCNGNLMAVGPHGYTHRVGFANLERGETWLVTTRDGSQFTINTSAFYLPVEKGFQLPLNLGEQP